MTEPTNPLSPPEVALTSFAAAWLASDATERRRHLEECWSDDGVFLSPNADTRGREELAETMASMSTSWPSNARIDPSEISEHHGWFRYTWNVVGEEGTIHGTGLHVAQLDDTGRLRRVVAFYGATPEPR